MAGHGSPLRHVSVGLASLIWVLAAQPAPPGASSRAKPAAAELRGRLGPWGQLEYTRIDIEPPPDLIPAIRNEGSHWFLGGNSQEQVIAHLRASGMSNEAISNCKAEGKWVSAPGGTVLEPPLAVVLAMKAGPRKTLYETLARFTENPRQRNPIPISPELVQSLEKAGLSTTTIARFKSLLYGSGPWGLFADLPAMLMSLSDDRERIQFATVIMRAESYVIRLRVDQTADVDALARYWSPKGSTDDIRPLLASLTRVTGGASTGIGQLLPPLAREHANRYPHWSDPVESHSDCFWTALNFFSERPDAPVDDPNFVLEALKTKFRPTARTPRLGDLVVLLNDRGAPVHAAVYIAEDFVFTKNGYGVTHPWTFMRLGSVVDLYTTLVGKLRVVHVTDDRTPAPNPILDFAAN